MLQPLHTPVIPMVILWLHKILLWQMIWSWYSRCRCPRHVCINIVSSLFCCLPIYWFLTLVAFCIFTAHWTNSFADQPTVIQKIWFLRKLWNSQFTTSYAVLTLLFPRGNWFVLNSTEFHPQCFLMLFCILRVLCNPPQHLSFYYTQSACLPKLVASLDNYPFYQSFVNRLCNTNFSIDHFIRNLSSL